MADTALTSRSVAGGSAQIEVKTGGYQTWRITQIATEADDFPSVGGTCKIRKNGNIVVPFMVPTGDVASGDPPIEIGRSDKITIDWTGADVVGTLVQATIFYEIV